MAMFTTPVINTSQTFAEGVHPLPKLIPKVFSMNNLKQVCKVQVKQQYKVMYYFIH